MEASAHLLLRYNKGQYTMDNLAADLNCSKKTIYKYFDSKEELIQSILKNEIDKIEREFVRLDNTICNPSEKALEALYVINEIVGKIHNSILYQQTRGKNLVMESYFDLRINVFEVYLRRFFEHFEKDFRSGFKTTEALSKFVIDTIEGHYFYLYEEGYRIPDKDFVDGLAFLIHRTISNIESK